MNDPLDRLRAANPARESDPTILDRAAILDDVTNDRAAAATFSPPPSRETVTTELRRRPRKGRILAGAAAAGVVGAIGFGALSLIPSSSTPAAAAMADAAGATASANSGTVTITLSADEGGDVYGATLFSTFDGSDFSAALVEASGDDLEGIPTDFEVRFIGNDMYAFDGTQWFQVDDPRVRTGLELSGFPLDIGSASEAVVDLVEAADAVVETEPGHFEGTVTVAEVKAVAANHPSLEFFVPELFDADLDEQEIELDLVLDDAGSIDVVTIGAVHDDEDASFDASAELTIDFDDLGEPQTIERPVDAQLLDLDNLDG